MNPTWTIDSARRLVIIEYNATGTYDGWHECLQAILADPAWVPGFGILVDREHSAPPRPEDARRMIAFVRSHQHRFGSTRWAVVSREVAELGMVRMTQALSTDIPGDIEYFPNRAEAIAWLLEDGHQGVA